MKNLAMIEHQTCSGIAIQNKNWKQKKATQKGMVLVICQDITDWLDFTTSSSQSRSAYIL